MNAVLTNQVADILQFNDNAQYEFMNSWDTRLFDATSFQRTQYKKMALITCNK